MIYRCTYHIYIRKEIKYLTITIYHTHYTYYIHYNIYITYTSYTNIHACIGIDRVITLSSTDLTYSAMTVRQLGLDVLVYPEIGADPVRYNICWYII